MSTAPADVVKDLAPTGKLRAAINLGNIVLAQRHGRRRAARHHVDLARELGRRLGVPVELDHFRRRRQGVRGAQGRRRGTSRSWRSSRCAPPRSRSRRPM